MTTPKQVNFNTLEQILSTDVQRVGALAGKAAMDPLVGMTGGLAATPRNVTLRGLLAVPGAGMTVDIGAGSMVRFNGAPAVDASQYELGVLVGTETVALAAADPTNPRIDVISGLPVQDLQDSSVRNILTLPGRTITPTAVDKTSIGILDLAVTTGTPGAAPAFPAVPAGRVALWYVFVPASAISIDDSHLMDARIYWRPVSISQLDNYRVQGLSPRSAVAAGTTSLTIEPGEAFVGGQLLQVYDQHPDELLTDILEVGGSTATFSEYDIFVVAKGCGVPMSKTVGYELVARRRVSGSNAATAMGQPASNLSFGPLRRAATPIAASVVAFATTTALYLGTVVSGSSAGALARPPSEALDQRGRLFNRSFVLGEGFEAGRVVPYFSGFLHPKGRFSYVSATQVQSEGLSPLYMDGTPYGDGGSLFTVWDITTDLASGEVEAASTWYYCYLRKQVSERAGAFPFSAPVGNLVPIISAEAPDSNGYKPTPEANFLSGEYIYVGAVYNGSAGNFVPFTRDGDTTLFEVGFTDPSFTIASLAADPLRDLVDLIGVPATARMAIVGFEPNATATGAGLFSAVFNVFREGAAAYFSRNTVTSIATGAGNPAREYFQAHVPVNANREIEVNNSTLTNASGAGVTMTLHGFVEQGRP